MNEREIGMIEAAVQVFLRYGVQRASMNDIAKEAGVARQTLYNTFSNKDDVLRATIRLFTDRGISNIEAGLETVKGLGPQLDLVFEQVAVRPFSMLHTSPNAEDLIQGMNAASREEIEENDARFRAVTADILQPFEAQIAQSGMSVAELADLIQTFASSAKTQAKNEAHLHALLNSLKQLVLRAAE